MRALFVLLGGLSLVACRSSPAAVAGSVGSPPPPPSVAPPLAMRGSDAPVAPSPRPAVEAPPPSTVVDLAGANLDPDDDAVVGPPPALADCEARLTALGAKFHPGKLTPRRQSSGATCGTEQAIVLERRQASYRFNADLVASCQLAVGLVRWLKLADEEARARLGTGIARVDQGGTYSCRRMARFSLVSEHSYANAIDIRSFGLSDGRTLSVLRDYGKVGVWPRTQAADFMRTILRRAYHDGIFSVALGPAFDALHRDHFHFDQARYRVDGSE
jgi:hypothetical protein